MKHKLFKITAVVILLASTGFPVRANAVSYAGEAADHRFRWRRGAVQIALSASLIRANSNIKSDSDVIGAIRRSLRAWERAANVNFLEISSEKLNVSPTGSTGDGISLITIAQTPENVLLFTKNPEETAATTRIFFDGKGNITEADIVLNRYQQFSTDGTFGTFDLESTLTHEIGHLLGLEHSAVAGATMHENYGKNGLYGLQNFGARTLAEHDLALIRAKYGSRDENVQCCGAISGRIFQSAGRSAKGVEIWAEEAASGKVFSQIRTQSDGGFRLDGLPFGTYKLFAQDDKRIKNSFFSVQEIGQYAIDGEEPLTVMKKLAGVGGNLDLRYIGFNAQLSELAIPLNAGKIYTLYLGGKNLDPKRISLSFSSPLLTIVPNTIISHDYGDDISVISFEVRVDPLTPQGEYTIFGETGNGMRRAVAGAVTIENFLNPLSVSALPED